MVVRSILALRAWVPLIMLLAALARPATAAQNLPLLNSHMTLVSCECPNCPCPGSAGGTAGASGTAPSFESLGPQADGDFGGINDTFAALSSGAWNINDSPGGYVDNPILGTWLRVRYDDANNGSRPDRAEFFYRNYRAGLSSVIGNSSVPNRVDSQLISTYAELLFFPRLSGFLEVAALRNDFTTVGGNATYEAGLGDMITGVKYLVYANEDQYLTAQLKTYLPTGNGDLALGTGHVSIEPGLLYISRLSSRSYFQAELRYWIPINGSQIQVWTGDFSGDGDEITLNVSGSVIRYGGCYGYDLYQGYTGSSPLNPYVSNGGARLTAVGELVGWTITGGDYTLPVIWSDLPLASSYASAAGQTIVNMKLGLRGSVGPRSLYVGWGHALTGAPFYEDLLRIEYRRMF